MERITYKPKVVQGKISGTGWPIDGHTLILSLWDYDNYEDWHLSGYPDEADQVVMETMFITEKAAGLGMYDTLEEFAEHWDGDVRKRILRKGAGLSRLPAQP